MNLLLGITLLITANCLLVASYKIENSTRKDDNILDQIALPSISPPVNFIFPGTKWCGILGNSAVNYTDLGAFNQTDACCRTHHQCEEVIEPIGSLHALENPTLLPRFDCKCELELFKCLKEIDDIPSKVFGRAYFNIMEKCFAEDHPAVECVKYQVGKLGFSRRCLSYKFDETQEKTYQYFDVPFFSIDLP